MLPAFVQFQYLNCVSHVPGMNSSFSTSVLVPQYSDLSIVTLVTAIFHIFMKNNYKFQPVSVNSERRSPLKEKDIK